MTDETHEPGGGNDRERIAQEGTATGVSPDAPEAGAPPEAHGTWATPGVPTQTEASRFGARAVSITVSVLGALALVLGGAGAAYGAVYDSVTGDGTTSVHAADAEGVTGLDIDHGFGSLSIEFESSTRQATLTTEGKIAERLVLDRDGSTLRLRSQEDGLPFGDWSWIFGGWNDQRATLTLPESMRGADLEIDSGAGWVIADGDFGAVEVSNGAGEVQVMGSAESATAESGAGHVLFALDGVDTVDVDISAGGFSGDFTGTAPSSIRLEVAAGGADVTVPDEEYRLLRDVSAGELSEGDLRIASDAPRVIDVTVAAGDVTLSTQEGAGY